MKKVYIIILSFFLIGNAIANTKKADRLFERWDYFKAAELYKKEAAKNPSAEVYYKLGQCYSRMNSYKRLEEDAYNKVNAYGLYKDPLFYLDYGHVLKCNGKNEQSKAAYLKYAELVPTDNRGNFYAESIDIVKKDHLSDENILVKNLTELNSTSADYNPVSYKDGIVFASSRKTEGHTKLYAWTGLNYLDLYYAKSTSDKMKFTNIKEFGNEFNNKKYHDGPACFSKNYDTLYVSRVDKSLKGKMKKSLKIERNKIFISTLEDNEWKKSIPFEYNNDTFSIANPYLSRDGMKLFFVSDMPGGYGLSDLYYSNKEGNLWSTPINLGPNVNTSNHEKFPMIDSLGNLYFSSDGYQGIGGMDICVATKNGFSFNAAKILKTPLNSSYDDYSILFTQYGRSGYISSNREMANVGDADIYYFDMNNIGPEVMVSNYVIGYVKTQKAAPVVVSKPIVVETPIALKFNPSKLENHFIYFDFDKQDLRPNAIIYLDSMVVFLKENPNMNILLTGHCDERGTANYNLKLSRKRSDITRDYLENAGISKNRISTKAYGMSRMVNKCEDGVICTEYEHQLNRRVEFYFE